MARQKKDDHKVIVLGNGLEDLARQAESTFMARYSGRDQMQANDLRPYRFNFNAIVDPYERSGRQVAQFVRSNNRVDRLFRYEFGNVTIPSLVFRAYRRMMKIADVERPYTTLPDAIRSHLELTRDLYLEFGHIVRKCESYSTELMDYYGNLFTRLKGNTESCVAHIAGSTGCDSLREGLDTALRQGDVKAIDMINYEHGKFFADLDSLDRANQRMLAKKDFKGTNGNLGVVRQVLVNLNNVTTYCQGICIDLRSVREHLEVSLPMYINGMYVSKAAKDMGMTLGMLGSLTRRIFDRYQQGTKDVTNLFHRQTHLRMFGDMANSLEYMNQEGVMGLRGYENDLTQELGAQGYKF